jgi:hypothetical protein
VLNISNLNRPIIGLCALPYSLMLAISTCCRRNQRRNGGSTYPVCLSTFEGHVGRNLENAWPVDWFLSGPQKPFSRTGWRTKNDEPLMAGRGTRSTNVLVRRTSVLRVLWCFVALRVVPRENWLEAQCASCASVCASRALMLRLCFGVLRKFEGVSQTVLRCALVLRVRGRRSTV